MRCCGHSEIVLPVQELRVGADEGKTRVAVSNAEDFVSSGRSARLLPALILPNADSNKPLNERRRCVKLICASISPPSPPLRLSSSQHRPFSQFYSESPQRGLISERKIEVAVNGGNMEHCQICARTPAYG